MTVRRLRGGRENRLTMMASQPQGWGWNDPAAIPPPGLFNQQRAGVPVTIHTSLQVDTVFTALRVISNSVIKMGNPQAYKWQYSNNNEPYRVFLPTQPTILSSTFGSMFQFDGQARSVISLALFGECFWYTLTRGDKGYPSAIEVLHPAFVTVDVDENENSPTFGMPIYYFGTGQNKILLDRTKMTHIPFMALPGARRGLSTIEYGGVSFALALAAMEYGQRWFSQGASPSFLLSTEGKLGDTEIKRIAEKFLVEHSGLQSAHLPLVVDSGLKVQKISSTPDEAQYINTLDHSRRSIAAWFGLPPHLVGSADQGNVWGKTVQEQGIQLVDFTLSGYTTRLNEAYSSLLPKGTFAALDENQIARADSTMVAEEIMANRQAGVETQNEIRVRLLRRPPLPGGDDLLVPMNTNTAIPVAGVLAEEAQKEAGGGPLPAASAPPGPSTSDNAS